MLRKRTRLTAAQFEQAFKTGKRLNTATITLVHTPSPHFHGAVVVGKKVFATAVARNRLRRRLYPVFRSLTLSEDIFIVLVKPVAKAVAVTEIQEDIRTLVQKVQNAVH